jgi:hypothetical protein
MNLEQEMARIVRQRVQPRRQLSPQAQKWFALLCLVGALAIFWFVFGKGPLLPELGGAIGGMIVLAVYLATPLPLCDRRA